MFFNHGEICKNPISKNKNMYQKIFLKKTTSHKTYLKKQNERIYLGGYYQRTIGDYDRPPYCCLQAGT